MPRKNAGHTGQKSRNPAGRPSEVEGRKVVASYALIPERKAALADLAAACGKSASAFLDGLIGRCGQDYALEVMANQLKGIEGDSDGVAEGTVGTTAVPGGGA